MRPLGVIIGRLIERLVNIAGMIAGWLVFLMMCLVLFEVFMRYIVHRPPIIADEFSGYLLVGCSYLAIAWGWKEGAHVRITLLVDGLSQRAASFLRLITLVLNLGFSFLLVWVSFKYLTYSIKVGMRSASWLVTPLQVPQSTLLVGFILLTLIVVLRTIQVIIHIASGKDLKWR
jgi:TRAP-type C4-dicarboxylate transport system permease small subunit